MSGRPTKYSDEILEKARDYLENYQEHGDLIPMIAGLSIALDLSRDTVYAWKEDADKAEFSYIVSKIMQAQENKLINGGLSGEFNASIAKLALTKHGYSDKKELTGQDGKDLIPDAINITYE